jgi:fructokinase
MSLLAHGAGVVLVTCGGGATTVVGPTGTVVVPVMAADVVDTIGAGDAFTAGFTTWWHTQGFARDQLADLGLVQRAVRAAHAVAAVVVTRRGADPPTRDELLADWAT